MMVNYTIELAKAQQNSGNIKKIQNLLTWSQIHIEKQVHPLNAYGGRPVIFLLFQIIERLFTFVLSGITKFFFYSEKLVILSYPVSS